MPNLNISLAPDRAAVEKFEARKATPSSMSSAEWERVAPAIREKCFFSARVNDAETLGKMRELIGKAVDTAKRNPSEALVSQEKFISEMKSYLRGRGYAVDGTALTDIASRRRLSLIYKMNYDEAREFAKYSRGQDSDALYMYPAQEFLRVEPRRVPRTDWQTRWRAAGGKIYGGRMVALKSSPVWQNLSRFDRPYPPYDFGSGMGVEDVDRDEAIELGLLPKDEPVDEIPDFDDALEAEVSLERIPEDLVKDIVAKTPNCEIRGDKLVMRSKPKLPTFADMKMPSAKTWESGTKFEKPETLEDIKAAADDARKVLKKGEFVETPIGNIKFDEHIYIDWEKYNKDVVDDRLSYYGLAKEMVATAREVWRQGNQMTFVNVYENRNGKIRGFVVVVEDGMVVRTYFIKEPKALDNARKGELVWRQ